jgi:hypothetical protein
MLRRSREGAKKSKLRVARILGAIDAKHGYACGAKQAFF